MASKHADANPSLRAVSKLLSLFDFVYFPSYMLSRPGLAVDAAHIFPGASLRVLCLFLGPALLFLHWVFGSFCMSLASICSVLVRRASLWPTQQSEIAAWACTFQVRPPWEVYVCFRPSWLRVKLAFVLPQKKNDIWGSCSFLNGVSPCDGARHLIVLQRVPFPKPPSPTAQPYFFFGGFGLGMPML